jgi:hypothetical protein
MSKSVSIITPTVLAWSKLFFALTCSIFFASIYAFLECLLLQRVISIPYINLYASCFWVTSFLFGCIIGVWFSRRRYTLRGGL